MHLFNTGTYHALISGSICVTSEQVPDDFRPRPRPFTPSCYLRQHTNPATATILVPPFPVSSTCHSGSKKKAFGLQLNEVATFPNRNPSEEEEFYCNERVYRNSVMLCFNGKILETFCVSFHSAFKLTGAQ